MWVAATDSESVVETKLVNPALIHSENPLHKKIQDCAIFSDSALNRHEKGRNGQRKRLEFTLVLRLGCLGDVVVFSGKITVGEDGVEFFCALLTLFFRGRYYRLRYL
jgi:hypothetical protein